MAIFSSPCRWGEFSDWMAVDFESLFSAWMLYDRESLRSSTLFGLWHEQAGFCCASLVKLRRKFKAHKDDVPIRVVEMHLGLQLSLARDYLKGSEEALRAFYASVPEPEHEAPAPQPKE